jgi:4-hydroxy-tetrahydrodipicolinate synthase
MMQGAFTAIVTPFRDNGEVDWPALASLVEFQVENEIDGIVPVGTTGESPTLDMEEHIAVIREVSRRARGRCKIIAGTGANSTQEALELTRAARDLGCDATLQVTPYYNRPNDEGLRLHLEAVADLGLPVVLYNVPGRTGKALSVELVAALAQHPNIVAVKEASGSVSRVTEYLAVCDLQVLSGDDPLTLPMMALGGSGVISVASNVIPGEVVQLVRLASTGNFDEALSLHNRWFSFFQALLGYDTNPIPVKTALALQGRIAESFRLPMAPMADGPRGRLHDMMAAEGLL